MKTIRVKHIRNKVMIRLMTILAFRLQKYFLYFFINLRHLTKSCDFDKLEK